MTTDKILTAKKLLEASVDSHKYGSDVEECMIEFAQAHVQAALEAAAEKGEIDFSKHLHSIRAGGMGVFTGGTIDKESILNAYPLTNIL